MSFNSALHMLCKGELPWPILAIISCKTKHGQWIFNEFPLCCKHIMWKLLKVFILLSCSEKGDLQAGTELHFYLATVHVMYIHFKTPCLLYGFWIAFCFKPVLQFLMLSCRWFFKSKEFHCYNDNYPAFHHSICANNIPAIPFRHFSLYGS